ncbi:MAG: T9SS type A sorting domain-containing protein [Melioribacteraceae bacterium]|nr:T9SS type A sorting domain-containing protein [Melioribacteraceae bacterium]MCF8264062.1 T9SS type A sorting domain-containing protein [Melioribacteraceae bacterium]MCF8413135.1 T9SS type A sorting domain-containing protein [Melioribacteraceae bacterium]MCF8430831.1 T9SS type A sorting domain-containing protein [Melioribacteraceae bacterium]
MRKILVLLFLISGAIKLDAQFQLSWDQVYDSGRNDSGEEIYFDSEGNIIVAGTALDQNYMEDALIVKYSPSGDFLWAKTYNIGYEDFPLNVYTDSEDNIILGVVGHDSSNYGFDFHFVKYSSNGDLLVGKRVAWYVSNYDSTYTYDIISSTRVKQLFRDNNNNYYLFGPGEQQAIFWSVQLDASGNFTSKVSQKLESLSDHAIYEYQPFFNSSNAYGYLRCFLVNGAGDNHFGVIQFDHVGVAQNYQRILTFPNQYIYSTIRNFKINNSAQIYLALDIQYQNVSADSVNYMPRVTCINPDGSLFWDEIIPSSKGYQNVITNIRDIDLDIGGNIWATGTQDTKAFIAKFSAAGETTWFRVIDEPWSAGEEIACDFRSAAFSYMNESADIWIRKYDEFGDFTTQYFIDGISNVIPAYLKDMKFDDNNNLITTGSEYQTTWNIHTRKLYDEATGLADENNPSKFNLSQNYPNPFNPSTTIKYNLPEASNVQIIIFNSLGEIVVKLLDEHRNSGQHSIDFTLGNAQIPKNLPSGIYFYQVRTNNQFLVRKMLLLK